MDQLVDAAVEQVALAPDGEVHMRAWSVPAARCAKNDGDGARARTPNLLSVPPRLAAPPGCSVAQLWSALSPAADEAGVQLEAPALRIAVWRLLTAEPGLRFHLPG